MDVCEEIYKDILKKNSYDLIVQDGRVLAELLLNVRDSAMSLSLIPFCALYCRSAKEFMCIEGMANETEKEIKDIRNGLKIFTGKYSKGNKMVFESDDQQNQVFQNELRFSFTKALNIHYNLGVYFDQHEHIIFNTQLANFYLNIPKNNGQSGNKHAMELGFKLGSEIAEILIKYCGLSDLHDDTVYFNTVPEYGYIDFNTNRKNAFFHKEFDKETNLMLLHMLSTIGFVNNVLVPVIRGKKVWLLRIIYITAHNTWLGLKKISQHLEQNKKSGMNLSDFCRYVEGDIKLFSSSFRNCMMHYDLVDKNNCPVILPGCYDIDKPLYGLVESCYDGMDYIEFYYKIYELSQDIEKYLASFFSVEASKICWDWN